MLLQKVYEPKNIEKVELPYKTTTTTRELTQHSMIKISNTM